MLVFAAGFVARPIGALAIGHFAARHGRQRAMLLSFMLMASGLALLSVMPPTRSIGLWAPLLILLARVLQGFSEGGEIGPMTTVLFDAAPQGRGGLYSSLQYLTQLLGSFAAVVTGLILSLLLTHKQLYDWGWRVPFALGLMIVPAGFALRWIATAHRRSMTSLDQARPSRAAVLLIGLTVASGTVATYLRHFSVSYAISVLHLSPRIGLFANLSGMLAGLLMVPWGWWLGANAHRFRRIIGMLILLTGALGAPLYWYATFRPGLFSQLLLNCVFFALSSLTLMPMWRVMLEALPATSRVMLFGFVYSASVSLFGGFTPAFVTWLIRYSGSQMVPGYLMAAAYGVQAVAWYKLIELERFFCD